MSHVRSHSMRVTPHWRHDYPPDILKIWHADMANQRTKNKWHKFIWTQYWFSMNANSLTHTAPVIRREDIALWTHTIVASLYVDTGSQPFTLVCVFLAFISIYKCRGSVQLYQLIQSLTLCTFSLEHNLHHTYSFKEYRNIIVPTIDKYVQVRYYIPWLYLLSTNLRMTFHLHTGHSPRDSSTDNFPRCYNISGHSHAPKRIRQYLKRKLTGETVQQFRCSTSWKHLTKTI